MADTADLLVEIGTEELPPLSVQELAGKFAEEIQAGLARATLHHGNVTRYATPRRIAVVIEALQVSQEERQIERRGPALSAAFDADENSTKAALGFAKSCGVDVEQLETLETDKGSWLAFRSTEVGQATVSLLPELVAQALRRLPIRRRMRWGDNDVEFVRPVHWVVLMLGNQVVEAEILGIATGRRTRGHRFHQPTGLMIEEPSEYAGLLYSSGHVVADFDARRDMIRKQVEDTAQELGGSAEIEEALLDEVTAIVEWPVPISGNFDPEFLALPDCVLIATMRGAQKYFHVVDQDGGLLPKFITISNIDSRNPCSVRAGNERVIRPRLQDAAFFYASDRKHPLESRLETIKSVKFQEKLGSLHAKTLRVSKLTAHIAIAMGQAPEQVSLARRAGMLCKCDLVTAMVGEFPELQGLIGKEYAATSGEPPEVADAIGALYLPRFAGDTIPQTSIGQALAMADKLDTLTGIFGIGQVPSGDKDPFALRRAALGVLRILIEGELNLDLVKLIQAAVSEHDPSVVGEGVGEEVFDFSVDRMKAYFLDQGVPVDVFAAVMATRPTRPFDFARRIHAVNEFRRLPEAASLTAANKRIKNILKQCDEVLPNSVNEALFSEDAEWNLAAKLVGLGPRVKDMLGAGDYNQAMTLLASLGDAIDQFFDTVTVMADNEDLRHNRLALLNNISVLFLATADISQLQT